MDYLLISNNEKIISIWDSLELGRIFIDLEYESKLLRQANLDTRKSKHSFDDILTAKKITKNSKIITRINSFGELTREEIENAITNGTDFIMLPYIKEICEVQKTIEYIDKRAKLILLIETEESLNDLEYFCSLGDVHEIYFGLNDLHLSFGMKFMFEPLANGLIDKASEICKKYNKPFGFGGITVPGRGLLEPELIMDEHVRLNSSFVIISRDYFKTIDIDNIESELLFFKKEMNKILAASLIKNAKQLEKSHKELIIKVSNIVNSSKVKKIAIVTTMYSSIRNWICWMLDGLNERKVRITIICNFTSEEMKEFLSKYPFCKMVFVPFSRGVKPGNIIKSIGILSKIFKNNDFDAIQYSTPNASFCSAVSSYFAKIKVRLYCQWGLVYSTRAGFKRMVLKLIEKIVCKLSTNIQPDSIDNLNFCITEKLYDSKKGEVILNGSAKGVDLSLFDVTKKEQYKNEICKKIPILQNGPVIGFVGRLGKEKGCNELFKSFFQVKKEYPNAKLLFIGPIEKEDSIESGLFEKIKSDPNVVITGRVYDVYKYYSTMDIFVLPSYREGFGMSIIEASSMSVPVIASRIPGPISSIIDGETGYLIESKSVEQLTEKIVYLLNNPEKSVLMGKNGTVLVNNKFEQNKFKNEYLNNRDKIFGLEKR